MKKIFLSAILILTVLFITSGCSKLVITQVGPDLDKEPNGIRVYPPRVLLFVGEKYSMIHYVPDYKRAYDVKPFTFFANQDFNIDVVNGRIQSLTSNQDSLFTYSILSPLEKEIGKAPITHGEMIQIEGTFGLAPGIYELQQTGEFKKIN